MSIKFWTEEKQLVLFSSNVYREKTTGDHLSPVQDDEDIRNIIKFLTAGPYTDHTNIFGHHFRMKTYEITGSYKTSFLIFSIIVSMLAIFLFTVGIINTSWQHLLFWGSVIVVVWGLFVGIQKKQRSAFWISLIIGTLVWILLLLQLMIRIKFIVENGGMEQSDGCGSPLAFLMGLIGEQLFFTPLCFVVVIGWLNVFKHHRCLIRIKKDSGVNT